MAAHDLVEGAVAVVLVVSVQAPARGVMNDLYFVGAFYVSAC